MTGICKKHKKMLTVGKIAVYELHITMFNFVYKNRYMDGDMDGFTLV